MALRSVLGEHATQAGSLVEPDKVRFDFTHYSALTKDEIIEIQKQVNDAILDDYPVKIEEMSMNDAKKLKAASLFGEKYGDIVRVVNIGDGLYAELCGGTHLTNTAQVGAFNITAEFSVASGVRRIEATTGKATLSAFNDAQDLLGKIAATVKATNNDDIINKIEQNMSVFRELRNKLDAAIDKESRGEASRMLTGSREIGGIKVISTIIEDADVDVDKLRKIEDTMRELEHSFVAALATVKDEKITIMVACGPDAVSRGIKAGELIREITKICGGSGGGKPEFAMGGGKDASKLVEALSSVGDFVKTKLNI
jgi:alanyl-tRNA synthetase